jgi:ribokinase
MTIGSGHVVVAGSVNLDTFVRVARLPTAGETQIATGSSQRLGGKGANQAVAARRAGSPVRMIGAVGDDMAARHLLRALASFGVDCDAIETIERTPSGSAVVVVDSAGENLIIVDSGANSRLTSFGAPDSLDGAAVLIVQGEMPQAFTVAAVETAVSRGVRVMVNLAPFSEWHPSYSVADPLVLNEVEAGQLLGQRPRGAADVSAMAGRILERCRSAVVTIGAKGAVLVTPTTTTHVQAPAVKRVVDSTGAGDAFVGVTAAGLAQGFMLVEAVRAGVGAASESVRHEGAGESYPDFPLTSAR